MAIGDTRPVLDAVERVTGALPFAVNLSLPGMLVAKVFRSPVPHAILHSVDISVAEELPGVIAVLTGRELAVTAGIKDQRVLAQGRIRYIGEPVAIVAAETARAAERALREIRIQYDELPGVYDALEAIKPGAPVLHEAYPDNCFVHAKLRHGDLEAGFAAADLILEGIYTSPLAQHVSLEPHVSAALWQGGRLTIWTGAQSPYGVRRALAEFCGISETDIRVIVPPLGGGYGGKGGVRIENLVAALARKVPGRLVKLALTREEEFVTVTKHAATLKIKSGVRWDGTLTARQATVYWGAGANADTAGLVRGSVTRVLGPYRLPAARVDAYGVCTNLPPAGAFRGAMSSQGTWAYESHTDELAERLAMDPLEFRLRNLLRDGDTFITGETIHDIHFAECLETIAKGIGWGEPAAGEAQEGSLRRGKGLGVMIKNAPATSRSECRLVLHEAGNLALYTSTVDMGQGSHTALAQIAAGEMELPVEALTVVGPDTLVTPYDPVTAASRSTNMMGNAVIYAAQNLKSLLFQCAAPLFEQPPEQLRIQDGEVVSPDGERMAYGEVLRRNRLQELEAHGEHSTKGGLDPETGQGIGASHYHQGAVGVEVEVDIETGKVKVLRTCGASFAGRVVNPRLAELQNDGNVIYGMGPALMEEMVVEAGQVVNTNLSEYQIPSFQDAPESMESYCLEAEGSDLFGIGEMTLPPVAPAIASAIHAAIGVRLRDLPLTAEKVWRAIANGEK